MKTLEEYKKEYQDNTLDSRFTNRLSQFIPSKDLKDFGLELNDCTPEEWDKNVIPFTRENVLKQLKDDVEFGFKKALDQRGISASLMFECVRIWNQILEEGLEDWNENHYAMYGLPLFKATAIKYGWENPIGDDTGEEEYYNCDEIWED